jgi:cytochrome c-type biogenesis protein CcmH
MRVLTFILIGLVSLSQAQEVVLDPRVFEIGRQLRCPTCIAETVADSAEGISGEMRLIIQEQLIAGKSEGEILAFFQERYGDWVLLDPPRRGIYLLVWASPVIAGLVAGVLLLIYMRRGQQHAKEPLEVSPDELERVRAALRQEG